MTGKDRYEMFRRIRIQQGYDAPAWEQLDEQQRTAWVQLQNMERATPSAEEHERNGKVFMGKLEQQMLLIATGQKQPHEAFGIRNTVMQDLRNLLTDAYDRGYDTGTKVTLEAISEAIKPAIAARKWRA